MSKKYNDLDIRMKTYEYTTRHYLVKRTPVICRIDGKSFHSFTKGFNRPFDDILIKTMQETTKYLCENIQGCVLGYTQSDEITLVLTDYKTLETCAWFDYNIQKCCSIAASMATMYFNKAFECNVSEGKNNSYLDASYLDAIENAMNKGAMFDARVHNIPKEEVANNIYWRQRDAIRNSIQMVGQANFSQKQLQNKSCYDILNMLYADKDIDWNDLPLHCQRGSCCAKMQKDGDEHERWYIDREIPIFKGDGRKYIEDRVFIEE